MFEDQFHVFCFGFKILETTKHIHTVNLKIFFKASSGFSVIVQIFTYIFENNVSCFRDSVHRDYSNEIIRLTNELVKT